jgi:hypothetical protein
MTENFYKIDIKKAPQEKTMFPLAALFILELT